MNFQYSKNKKVNLDPLYKHNKIIHKYPLLQYEAVNLLPKILSQVKGVIH